MLHDVGNNRDCDVDVDHRNNTIKAKNFSSSVEVKIIHSVDTFLLQCCETVA